MKRAYRVTFVLVCIAAASLCMLPVMSVYLNDGEICTLFVRGYNLMEFSAWSCVPLLAPLLIPMVLFGTQTKAAKEIEFLILFIGNMICYVHSVNAARAWLTSLGDTLITYYPGMFLTPFAFVVIVGYSALFEERKGKA